LKSFLKDGALDRSIQQPQFPKPHQAGLNLGFSEEALGGRHSALLVQHLLEGFSEVVGGFSDFVEVDHGMMEIGFEHGHAS
jgi:hypothetical protein